MDDFGMITIKKTHVDQRISESQKNNMNSSSSLPDIQIENVDSDPFNITKNNHFEEDFISNVVDVDTFNFTYYGSTTIDKRMTPSVFPWIAKRILKYTSNNSKDVYANISQSKMWLTERNKTDINFQEHSFDSIYRLSRMNKYHMDEYLAYIICTKASGPNAVFHLLKCNDQNEKHTFLNSLKTRVLGFQKVAPQSKNAISKTMTPPRPTHKRGVSSGAILVSPVKKDSSFCDSIYYVGKVNLQQPQAPPQFIDKVLVHLKKMASQNDLPQSKNNLRKKRLSLDGRTPSPAEILANQPKPKKPLTRKRSASVDSDKYNPHQVNLKNPPQIDMSSLKNNAVDVDDEYDGPSVFLNNINDEVKSRLINLELSKHFLSLYSMGTKKMLLQKKIQNISFCTKGDLKKDHFGFICRESGNHICYIFQGESEQKVDEIMAAMRVAFAEALKASADSTLCDSCPIQNLHRLCNNLEGANTISDKDRMIHETIKILSDYEQLHVLNEVNEQDPESDNERIEITVHVLRELFDSKQVSHKHSLKLQHPMEEQKDKLNLSSSGNSTIFGKAKKSLTSSFTNFSMKKVRSMSLTPLAFEQYHKRPNQPKVIQQPVQRNENETKPRSRSLEAPEVQEFGQNGSPRLELNLESNENIPKANRRTSSIEGVEKKVPKSVTEEKENELQSEQKEKPDFSKQHRTLSRQQSWRQAIFHSVVVTNSRRSSASSVVTLTGDSDELKAKDQNVDIGARARSRWRNAIHNQILLIRMEKENKKLAANISASEIRRQKLSYQDLSTFTEEAAKAWDEIILHKSNEKIEKQHLLELIRGGIPRARRGEIWQFLVKQYMMAKPETSEKQTWKDIPYRALLKKNSGHQHAILIDLGRTFPTHVHFIPRLGSGQISLFNILTAYSQLDDEVGYCQGLSFVAGVLLMHMSEEDAFKCFCHLMFELQIRNQYKPDMNAVQQQLYQLSRLLHDYHPKVYEHFNKYDVTPTLYAAPWFLTLYASQYPIGFVSRVMDMVLLEGLDIIFKIALVLIGNHADEILERDSFESIVDYMKLDLPTKVVTETDDISKRALNMDIKHQLNLYEVEYQLLNEEMIDIRQNKEKYEKQEVALEEVKQQMVEMKKELKNTQKTVRNLQSALDEANRKNREYEMKIKLLSKVNESYKSEIPNNCNDTGNWDLLPSPHTLQKEMLKCNMGRAMSLDSGSVSLLSSEENISCEMDL